MQPQSSNSENQRRKIDQSRPPPGVDGQRRRRWSSRRSVWQRNWYASFRSTRQGRRWGIVAHPTTVTCPGLRRLIEHASRLVTTTVAK